MAGSVDPQIIKNIIHHHRGASKGRIKISPILTGKFNTSFLVSTPTEELVLRLAPLPDEHFLFYEKNMMAQEPGLHQILREKTSVPVPEIVVYDNSHSLIERDFLLMERLPGTPASEAPLTRPLWNRSLTQIGEYLAQVHAITAEQFGYLGEHKPMNPQSDWFSAFAIMWAKMIRQIKSVQAYSQEEADQLIDLLETHKEIFTMVPSSLLHMDVWAQNILVDENGNVTGLLDWDRALWGDPEIEYAVLDYCGISEPAFWQGYGAERDDSSDAQIRFIFYYLYEIQKYIFIRAMRQKDWSQAMAYKRESFRIAQGLM